MLLLQKQAPYRAGVVMETLIVLLTLVIKLSFIESFQIIDSTNSTLKTLNETLELHCTISSAVDRWKSCWWIREDAAGTNLCNFASTSDSFNPTMSCLGELAGRNPTFFGDYQTCGISVTDVNYEDNSTWSCVLDECDENVNCFGGSAAPQVTASSEVTVMKVGSLEFLPPKDPFRPFYYYESDKPANLTCVATAYRPLPMLEFAFVRKVGDESEAVALSNDEWTCPGCDTIEVDGDGLYTVTATLLFPASVGLNGTTMSCRVTIYNKTSDGLIDVGGVPAHVAADIAVIVIVDSPISSTTGVTASTSTTMESSTSISSSATSAPDSSSTEISCPPQKPCTCECSTKRIPDCATTTTLSSLTTTSAHSQYNKTLWMVTMIIFSVICVTLMIFAFLFVFNAYSSKKKQYY